MQKQIVLMSVALFVSHSLVAMSARNITRARNRLQVLYENALVNQIAPTKKECEEARRLFGQLGGVKALSKDERAQQKEFEEACTQAGLGAPSKAAPGVPGAPAAPGAPGVPPTPAPKPAPPAPKPDLTPQKAKAELKKVSSDLKKAQAKAQDFKKQVAALEKIVAVPAKKEEEDKRRKELGNAQDQLNDAVKKVGAALDKLKDIANTLPEGDRKAIKGSAQQHEALKKEVVNLAIGFQKMMGPERVRAELKVIADNYEKVSAGVKGPLKKQVAELKTIGTPEAHKDVANKLNEAAKKVQQALSQLEGIAKALPEGDGKVVKETVQKYSMLKKNMTDMVRKVEKVRPLEGKSVWDLVVEAEKREKEKGKSIWDLLEEEEEEEIPLVKHRPIVAAEVKRVEALQKEAAQKVEGFKQQVARLEKIVPAKVEEPEITKELQRAKEAEKVAKDVAEKLSVAARSAEQALGKLVAQAKSAQAKASMEKTKQELQKTVDDLLKDLEEDGEKLEGVTDEFAKKEEEYFEELEAKLLEPKEGIVEPKRKVGRKAVGLPVRKPQKEEEEERKRKLEGKEEVPLAKEVGAEIKEVVKSQEEIAKHVDTLEAKLEGVVKVEGPEKREEKFDFLEADLDAASKGLEKLEAQAETVEKKVKSLPRAKAQQAQRDLKKAKSALEEGTEDIEKIIDKLAAEKKKAEEEQEAQEKLKKEEAEKARREAEKKKKEEKKLEKEALELIAEADKKLNEAQELAKKAQETRLGVLAQAEDPGSKSLSEGKALFEQAQKKGKGIRGVALPLVGLKKLVTETEEEVGKAERRLRGSEGESEEEESEEGEKGFLERATEFLGG